MTYHAFLIKYAEIGIKGKNRGRFEDQLINQIHVALKRCSGGRPVRALTKMGMKHDANGFTIDRTSGRIYVNCPDEYDYDEVTDALTHVFGIVGICPVHIMPVVPVPELTQAAVRFFGEGYEDREVTFKVHARRLAKSYPMESMEINAEIGAAILEAYPEARVDVHDPQVMLHVEIRERIYLYSHVIPGPGGLPVGSAGKAMLLLSGGIDSPVAGWMCAKRGLRLDAVYFNAPPYTSERALQKVLDLAEIISRWAGPIYLHNINFTDIQLYIYDQCPHDELTVIMRRYMMRIAETIAKRTECEALITGESLGQVASQTTRSLAVTNAVCTLPVFRPLIAFDKEDIITVSKRIGTFDTSILPYEDCCTIFVAKHPVTRPLAGVIEQHERNLAERIDALVEQALRTDEIISVGPTDRRIIKTREQDLQPGM